MMLHILRQETPSWLETLDYQYKAIPYMFYTKVIENPNLTKSKNPRAWTITRWEP